ncbi:hypothetical protein [Dietzia cinnamea]|uniref:hypothetical protein n=1 Tax=Dietzia cinnamea TaxID=321318 RepID=UPI00223B0621|nr:hypothetical protein [Dietzia cinnamea]MCT2062925.1 hypothetical protein [Dietzia cinnamea]MCT2237728.1 hypothetical protein [Dietzia cinnamea]MCT2302483.1 hypothetical protein [Dietzia cinnamea]
MASPPVAREHLPYPVLLAAAWSACLLLIAGGGWLLGQAIGRLSVIIAPVAIAVLLAVMLRPLVDRIPQRVPRAAAALVVVGVMAARTCSASSAHCSRCRLPRWPTRSCGT